MFTRFTALAVGLAAPALAQKPVAPSPFELGSDPVEAVSSDGSTFLRSSRPAFVTRLDAPVAPGAPEAQARAFLAGYGSQLGLRDAGTSDLALATVRTGDAGSVVKLQQTVGGVPVWGAVTSVGIDLQDRVQLVANGYRADLGAVDVAPAVTEADARASLAAHLGLDAAPIHEVAELIVWPATPARLGWRVELVAPGHGGLWEGVVDAHTGELVRVADRTAYHGGEDPPPALPLADYHPAFRADGTALVFDPDPLTRAQVPKGTPGYTDGNDADTPQLTAARVLRTLPGIEFSGGQYRLSNEWAEITEWDPPTKGLFSQASSDFEFTRNQDGFEAVTTFWHIDNYMRYLNDDLSVEVQPYAYSSGVRFDAHGWNGADQSSYSGGSFQRLTFGEGCVDDGEDADVILHELGHGIHHWLVGTGGGPSNGDGLSEGFGDYVANSYVRSLGLLPPNDPAYNRVFRWDGWYSNCWNGRITNYTATYPTGFLPHGRGQHWSTSNLRVWDVIGGERTDKAVMEGLAMTTPSSTQPQAAQAVLQAAANMGYSQAELTAFYDSYIQQGYDVEPVGVSNEAASAEGVAVSAPAPNPFNGLTTFDVIVDAPQAVTVEVFDAVGRRVATLFDGDMTAAQRYPVALDAAELRSGVYVVRVSGASFTTSRRVTVVR